LKTPLVSIACFLLAAIFGAGGQYLYKSGAEQASGGLLSYVTNWRLLCGVVCYVAVMALFVIGFKRGGQISVLYPLYATTFIWAALISRFAYGSQISLANVGGMVLLVGGMLLMGLE
jgi:multidrug transporter EmrE-like cation transporter